MKVIFRPNHFVPLVLVKKSSKQMAIKFKTAEPVNKKVRLDSADKVKKIKTPSHTVTKPTSQSVLHYFKKIDVEQFDNKPSSSKV